MIIATLFTVHDRSLFIHMCIYKRRDTRVLSMPHPFAHARRRFALPPRRPFTYFTRRGAGGRLLACPPPSLPRKTVSLMQSVGSTSSPTVR